MLAKSSSIKRRSRVATCLVIAIVRLLVSADVQQRLKPVLEVCEGART